MPIRRRGRDIHGVGEPGLEPASPADPYSALIHQTLKPALRIQFLDGEQETLDIELEWVPGRWYRGDTAMPGWEFKPTKRQLAQIGGPEGGIAGGEDAIESISMDRYEGDMRRGKVTGHGREYCAYTSRPCPARRSFTWEFVNDRHVDDPEPEQFGDSLAEKIVGYLLENDDPALQRFTRRAFKPILRITFEDNGEVMDIPLYWEKMAYMRGGSTHPGLYPKASKAQRRRFAYYPRQGTEPGDFALECIISDRYEGYETEGYRDGSDIESPNMRWRNFKWEYVNAGGEPPDEMYESGS